MSAGLRDLRRKRARVRNARAKAIARLRRADAALANAKADGTQGRPLTKLRTHLTRKRAVVTRLALSERVVLDAIDRELAAGGSSPIQDVAALDARFPVLLFPVRIETRFRRTTAPEATGPAGELLVRIYPDGILSDSHEPLLTPNETAAGQGYWRKTFAGIPEADAWATILTETSPQRAAWIVDQTKPTNFAASGTRTPTFRKTQWRPSGWSREAEAPLLPERWVVSAFRDGVRVYQVFTNPIREGLALTPGEELQTKAETVDLSGDGLIVSRRLSWVYDFEEAVKAGMAVRLPITAEDLARGFSSLLVLGVRTLTDPISQSSEIHRLFDAHRYSRGLAFVAQGEKTSNTEEGASSFPLADPGGAVSFISARGKPMARPNNDGGRFARALGVKATVAHHVHGADRDDQKGSAAMVEALWPATIGYFIEQMLPSVIAPEAAASIRNHALKWLRGRGHLPPFRVGPVPYGVLPVGALSRMDWEAGSDPDHRLAAALRRLRSVWVDAAASLPHVGRSSDTDRDLIEILAQDASAQSVQLRKAFGQDTIWNLFSYGGLDLSEWQSRRAAIVSGLLEAVGQTEWNARLLHLTFADDTHDFAGPLVEASPLSDTEPLAVNYISWLRTASPDQLRNQNPEELAKGSHALLFLMLRHGLLAAYHSAAQRLIAYAGKLDAEVVPEPELVAIIPTTKTAPSEAITPWLRFATKIKAITGDQSVGMFLADEKKPKQALPRAVKVILKELDQYRGSLKALEPLATAELQRLFTETLDVSSHRIDAWITSVFAERLEAMRSAEPLGSYVASYAWVEHLRPDAPADLVAVKTPRGSEQAVAASGSYLQAPSLLHGAAAAVLRSAHLARRADGQQPYAIDLSSRRTRSALAMIETVRESQPLGAALGYQFERGLHEGHPGRELDRYLDLFRGLYPLVANKAENSGDPTESVAARNVVDGLRLWEAWRAGAIPFGEEGLDPSVDERAAIESELRRLDDTIDAIGDLLLSESVFQILKGSSAGAAASLDSLAKGKRAPEPEVVATPRGGAVIHQRVALVLPTATLSGAWSALGISPRAAAAPELNAWLSALLGPPDEIGCTVHRQNVPPTLVTIAALGLQPVDLLALAGQVDTGGQGTGELDSRVAWRVNDLGSAPDPAFSIDYTSAAPGQIAIAAALELLASIQRLLGSARALAPRDLIRPEMGGRLAEADTMPDDLAARAGTARAALDVAIAALRGAKEMVEAAPDAPVALAALRDALIEAAAFGVVGAVPPIMHGDRDGLLARAKSTLAELTDRQQRAAAATDGAAMLAMLFGRSFPILPRFRPAAADIIQTSLATEPDLGELPDATVEFWLSGLARVREPLDMLHRLQLYARALGRPWPRARIVQLPLDGSASRWVGLDFDGGVRSRAGVVSLALLGDIPPAGGPWCGALIDSWPEIIPNAVEDTGIAFQYDAPGVQAPQCVLIAVPPVSEKNWSYELLEETLLDTLQLAKIRAVDLPSLGTLGQLLPTVLLAANSENATISTSFAGHVRDGPTIVPGGNA